MRFDFAQRYDADLADVVALYLDEGFLTEPAPGARIAVAEITRHEVGDRQAVVGVRYRFVADLPAAAVAVVNPAKLTWIEETTYDLGAATAAVAIRPDHYADRLRASATVTFTEAGGVTTRTIRGELRVRALLVGGQVERAIVEGMGEHVDAEADRARARLGA